MPKVGKTKYHRSFKDERNLHSKTPPRKGRCQKDGKMGKLLNINKMTGWLCFVTQLVND